MGTCGIFSFIHPHLISDSCCHEARLELYLTLSKFASKHLTKKLTQCQKTKKRDSSSSSDSGPDDKAPPKKVAKTTSGGGSSTCTMENGEPTWLVGGMKFVKVREFKGKTYIDIREYYVDKKTMETKPGK